MAAEGVAMFDKIFSWMTAPVRPVAPPAPPTSREIMILFGAKIRLARSKFNLSQKELAELLPATTPQNVHEWEFAKAWPRPTQRAALFDLFGSELA